MYRYHISEDYKKMIKNEEDVLAVLKNHSLESFIFSIRTGEFNFAIAKELGFNQETAEKFFLCGLYHDVGKIGMPKKLIDYPGRYTEEMREVMQQHTIGGSDILKKASANEWLIETAQYHHCNYDGSGYLDKLAYEEIPFHARMTRVSDSADAYLSKRSYKESFNVEGLYKDISEHNYTWYDPDIVGALKNIHERIEKYARKSLQRLKQFEYMRYIKKFYDKNNTLTEIVHVVIRNA